MKKSDRKKPKKEATPGLQVVVPLADMVRQELRAFVISQGIAALALMLKQDRVALCGPAYERGARTRRSGPVARWAS